VGVGLVNTGLLPEKKIILIEVVCKRRPYNEKFNEKYNEKYQAS
jgi:hypothetical protein